MLTACTSGKPTAPGKRTTAVPTAAAPARWTQFRHLPGVVDVAGPRGDGSFVVSAAGVLYLLSQSGTLTPFARGAGGYRTSTSEPYLTVAENVTLPSSHCSFGVNEVFAVEPASRPAVIEISPAGQARQLTGLPPGSFLTG